ncbi:integrase core domain-containing protein [Streptosporangium sp. NPDC001559]|uniref:integrase core domain-containing protein n=1 Tax=Streptosporangium sp. NPDC001559 TaxID=3366187 RepID=UPI0036E3AC57
MTWPRSNPWPRCRRAIDAWAHTYNHARPHQALNMATPAGVFRPHGPTRDDAVPAGSTPPHQEQMPAPPVGIDVAEPPAVFSPVGAVEFDVRVPPSGQITLVPGKQRVGVNQGLTGRTLTIWAGLRSIHLLLDGHRVRTVASRLLPEDLAYLAMRGARPAGAEPAAAALPRLNGRLVVAAGQAVEVDRTVHHDGHVQIAFALAGRSITLRLDGHLMHAIADGALVGTVGADRLAGLPGARTAATQLPPPPQRGSAGHSPDRPSTPETRIPPRTPLSTG